MVHILRNGKILLADGLRFVLWTAFFGWLVFLAVRLVQSGWHIGVVEMLCYGLLTGAVAYLSGRYGYIIWTAYDKWHTERLTARYRRKYLPHAEDELFLRKAYGDAVAIAATLYPFFLGKSPSVRAEVLFEMLEELEKKKVPNSEED